MKLITVVILAHDSQPCIVETLQAIRAQTYARDAIETIVVDYGSSDAGSAIAQSFLARHAMRGAVLVNEQAKGIAAAMNQGWKAAAGEWIQFINAGDLLAPNKIEVQAKLIARLPDTVGVICSSWQRLRLAQDQWLRAGPIVRPGLTDPVILKLASPSAGCLGAALIRNSAIAAAPG